MPLEIKEIRIRANLEKAKEAGGNTAPASDASDGAGHSAVSEEILVEKVVERLLSEHLDRIREALDQMER